MLQISATNALAFGWRQHAAALCNICVMTPRNARHEHRGAASTTMPGAMPVPAKTHREDLQRIDNGGVEIRKFVFGN